MHRWCTFVHWGFPQPVSMEKHWSAPQGNEARKHRDPQESSFVLECLRAPGQAGSLPPPRPPRPLPWAGSISGAVWGHSMQCRLPSKTTYSLTAAVKGQTNSRNHVPNVRVCPGNQCLDLSGWCKQVLSKQLCTLLQAPWGPACCLVLLKGRSDSMGPSSTLVPCKHILNGWELGNSLSLNVVSSKEPPV